MSKKCTPLWREAHFQVKMYKTHQVRKTLEVAMSKKCTPLWRKAHFQVKMYKTHQVRKTLEVAMSKKCTPLWREAQFEVKMRKTAHVWATLSLTTSKRKELCETSSIFQVDNIKSEAILRGFLQKCRVDSRVPMRLRFFSLHLSKSAAPARKSDARSYEVLHLPRKIILANLKIRCSNMQAFSGTQCPDLRTSLMSMSLVPRHAKCIFADPLQVSHACQCFWKCYKTLTFCSLLTRCAIPCACHGKRHLNVQKCSVPIKFLQF